MDVTAFFKHLLTMTLSAVKFIFSDVYTLYPFKVVFASVFGVGLFSLVFRFFKGKGGY